MSALKPRPSVVQDELCVERPVQPCALVIFGASGDLVARKLIPSLAHLFLTGLLHKKFYVIGVSRTPMDDPSFRLKVRQSLDEFARFGPVRRGEWDEFCSKFHYVSGDYSDLQTYRNLGVRLAELDREHGTGGNRIFYLSTPPAVYGPVVERLGESGLARPSGPNGFARVIFEKPFGRDLKSAMALSAGIARVFDESQVYRIDHYLGKETVQNMLILRFANAIFEPLWNRNYIDHVQITSAESAGVEHRAGYYDGAGALRDMVQNHLLQLLCLTAMEPPANFEADAVRDEKSKVLRSIRPLNPNDLDAVVARGQYGEGPGAAAYRREEGVPHDSRTETFAALKVFVDNWRWQDVPFYLRTGKRLENRVAEVAIQFKRVPHVLFHGISLGNLSPNVLSLRIQPDESVSLRVETKHPGPKLCMSSVEMDFMYRESFGAPPPEAYERLLLDCMAGDQTLYARRDWVDLSWAYLQPLLDAWSAQPAGDFPNYPAGGWGPRSAMDLIERDGRVWRDV